MSESAIIVHDLDQARAAVAAAAESGVALLLLSAPGGGASLGAPVFRRMVETAAAEHPAAKITAVLDCGDDAARALAAVRHGIAAVRIDLRPDVAARVRDIAAQAGVRVIAEAGEALDLLGVEDPLGTCRAWLACRPAPRSPVDQTTRLD